PGDPISFRGRLFFGAEGEDGRQLWVTDGTCKGTRLLKTINPGGHAYPWGFMKVGKRLVFSADDGVRGDELWVTNGKRSGTKLLKNIVPGAPGSRPGPIGRLGHRAYFAVASGYE